MSEGVRAITAIITAAFGLALASVIFSQRSKTTGVIQVGGQAISSIISAATAPVTGASSSYTGAANLGSTPLEGILGQYGLGAGAGMPGIIDSGTFTE
jgi:hypothetical protein